jgi:mono/diheme cytochrome c family protein
MRKTLEIGIFLAAAAVMTTAALEAPAQPRRDAPGSSPQALPQPGEREVIPGADFMSSAERDAYRQRMEAASTPGEKARVRAEHLRALEQRKAKQTQPGDPVRGATLHRGCFGCHGIERYTAPVTRASATFIDSLLRASGLSDMPPAEPSRFKGRIKSLAALREAVLRRNDYLSPKMTPQEVEDVVAYLNVTYYNFPPQ